MSVFSQSDNPFQSSFEKKAHTAKTHIGTFEGHFVRIGNFAERVDKFAARRRPVMHFSHAAHVALAPKHEIADAIAPLKTLARPGALDVKKFLMEMRHIWYAIGRLMDLHVINNASTKRIREQRKAAKLLSDEELAHAFCAITSPEMDVLEVSLLKRLRNGRADALDRHFSECLFDLGAILLKELSSRIAAPLPDDPPEKAAKNRQVLVDAITSREFVVRMDTKLLFDGVLSHPDRSIGNVFNLTGTVMLPTDEAQMNHSAPFEESLFEELDGQEGWTVEQSLCDVLLSLQNRNAVTRTMPNDAGSSLVLKPEVLTRAMLLSASRFHAPNLKVDNARREVFYRLLDGSGMTPELVATLRRPTSPEHKMLEAWFDKLEGYTGLSARLLLRHPEGFTLPTEDDLDRLDAVLIGVFGVRDCNDGNDGVGSIPKKRAPFASGALETFFMDLNEFGGTSLALSVLASAEDRPDMATIPGLGFIQAKIHGHILPLTDVAEIRIPLHDFPKEAVREAAILRARAISKKIGIPVVFYDDALLVSTNRSAPVQLPVPHGPIDAISTDPVPFIETWLAKHPECLEGIAPHRLRLDGPALGTFAGMFREAYAHSRTLSGQVNTNMFLDDFMREEGRALIAHKAALLKTLDTLPFETPNVHAIFENWILSAFRPFPKKGLETVFRKCTLISEHLNWFIEHPEATPFDFFSGIVPRLEGLLAHLHDVRQACPSEEYFHNHWVLPAINRIGFGALGNLTFGNAERSPDDLRRLFTRLQANEFSVCSASLNAIMACPQYALAGEESEKVKVFVNFMSVFMQVLGTLLESLTQDDPEPFELPGPRPFNVPLEFVPDAVRQLLASFAPTIAKRFETDHPGFRTFPPVARPERLPHSKATRRAFLESVLEHYREREATFDQLEHRHGRAHLVRSIIFASALYNFLRETGLPVDARTAFCGIACHDIGRTSPVYFLQAEMRAKTAIAFMKQFCGKEALGFAWEKAFYRLVYDTLPDGTLESLVVRAADSLDNGRKTTSAQEIEEAFIFLKGANETALRKLRGQLLTEADRLLRLSNPLCTCRRALVARKAAVVNLTEPPAEALRKLEDLQGRIDRAFEEERKLSNSALIDHILLPIRELPELFPLLHRYTATL